MLIACSEGHHQSILKESHYFQMGMSHHLALNESNQFPMGMKRFLMGVSQFLMGMGHHPIQEDSI